MRGVAGIGGGNLGVSQSYIADVTPPEYRERAYALFGAVFGIGIVLGPLTGGFLVHSGYQTPFLVAAGIEIINIVLTVFFLPSTRRAPTEGRFSFIAATRAVARLPAVRRLISRHFLFIFAVTYFFTTFSLYARNGLHLGPSDASWLLAETGIIGGLTLVLLVNRLSRRIGEARVAQIGLALSLAAYAAQAFARELWSFVVVLAVWSMGAACVEPTIAALLSQEAPRAERGAAMGVNDAMSNLALMLAPSLGGFIIDSNIALVGLVPGLAVLGAMLLGAGAATSARVPQRIPARRRS
jgi:DHA1 family tetracycline resistance protein-like MFS transporter